MPTKSGRRNADKISGCVDAIRRIVRALRLAAQRTQRETGISAAQLFVLEQLGEGANATMSLNELAARTLTDRTSVAEVVDRLRRRKLLDRVTDSRDQRRAAISLTPKGRALLRRAPSPPAQQLIDALGELQTRDLDRLADGLAKLTRALRADVGPAPMLFGDDAHGKRPASRTRRPH